MFRTNRTNRSIARTAVAAISALALIPAGASAATTYFGSSLNHSPANAGSSCAEDGVMGPSTTCTHVGSFYPGFSGRAKANVNGTVTAFKVRAQGPTWMRFRLVKVQGVSADHKSGQAKTVAVGPLVHVNGPTESQANDGIYPVETFATHLKVKKGYEVAVDTKHNTAEYCTDGTPGQLLFDPILKFGQAFRQSNGTDDCLMLVRAVVRH
jgi:hypothetical protein